ncbi:DUF5652 family protein [Chloroflexota bacterium]
MQFDWGFCPFLTGTMWFIIPLAIVWSMTWKGIALWKAGKNGNLAWFIVLFIFNTLGILPIIYIFAFSKTGDKTRPEESEETINEQN